MIKCVYAYNLYIFNILCFFHYILFDIYLEPKKTTTNMLKVTKLPSKTTEDGLRFFFENTRKSGGGDVDDVEYDEDTASAIITFIEDEGTHIFNIYNSMH